jgi:hypothetical protein
LRQSSASRYCQLEAFSSNSGRHAFGNYSTLPGAAKMDGAFWPFRQYRRKQA